MNDTFFDAPGRFWRGNLHTHSNRSDGVLEPQEVCRRYQAEGYDFIALTDHFVGLYDYPITDTTAFRSDGFTTILGAELHTGAMENGEIWHILAVGLPLDFKAPDAVNFEAHTDQESGPSIAQRARDAGAFVAIAHPEWSQMSMNDARSIEAAHAVEIYNTGCDTVCGRGFGFWIYEHLLIEGRRLHLCATDDAHFNEPDFFGGWVMVKAERNEPDALVQALKNGHFYSSTGPEIHHVDWGTDGVIIECSPVSTAVLQGTSVATPAKCGEMLTRVHLPYGKLLDSPWLRVSVMDRSGKRAWTNPIWRDT